VGVIVNSLAGQQQHQKLGYRPRAWKIIPNGFDTNRYRPGRPAVSRIRSELGLPDNAILLALVARLDPMKDHQTFLLAMRKVIDIHANTHAMLIGAGTESLAESVAHLQLSDHVQLLGPREDLERILPEIDIACLSSAFGEGFPNVLGRKDGVSSTATRSTGVGCSDR
jgi:glycosyltransferase involved in cell wall biosynthesis